MRCYIEEKNQFLGQNMKIENETLTGERAEYFSADKEYIASTFKDGESPLKHARNISVTDSKFEYKYPLWNTENVSVENTTFEELSRSGLWYVKNMSIKNSRIVAPKEFRRSSGIYLENVVFENAGETFWSCSGIKLKNVKAAGDYFAMNSQDFYAEDFTLDGNYFLDGGKNIEVHNSILNSKDAFWNCENVTVYNSRIIGEYLGWNSKNLKFVNCTIESNQGLCYIDGLVLENCTLVNTDLAFEYCSNISATVNSRIESVKNPVSGKITAAEIGTLILNPKRCNPSATKIECEKIGRIFSQDPNPNEN